MEKIETWLTKIKYLVSKTPNTYNKGSVSPSTDYLVPKLAELRRDQLSNLVYQIESHPHAKHGIDFCSFAKALFAQIKKHKSSQDVNMMLNQNKTSLKKLQGLLEKASNLKDPTPKQEIEK
jgi:hypothetical protein